MIKVDCYKSGKETELWEVFYTAIRLGCTEQYSEEQLQAWAPDDLDQNIFVEKMRAIKPFIASLNGKVVGYADLQEDGYIDHFFVHGRYQAQGVGVALMHRILEKGESFPRLYSNVSETAKPFFEKQGFSVVREQLIEIGDQHLANNLMEKLGCK